MARPRTATNILEMKGAFKRNPQRKRESEPQVSSVIRKTPPRHLDKDQKACWKEILKLAPAGVLTSADAIAVELVACLLAEFRENPLAMPAARITRLATEMKTLGLNPSGRASLVVPTNPAPDDDFHDV